MNLRPLRFLLFGIIIALLMAKAVFSFLPQQEEAANPEKTGAEKANAENTGDVAIGGHFTLKDQQGRTVTHEDLKGHYSLVFFGFTHCPAVCPVALATITEALNNMPKEEVEQITPIFISVDPKRDTVEVMRDYAKNFHPKLLALTGTEAETSQAAAAYKVYHAKVGEEKGMDYQVDHSGFIYLMDKEGRYLAHFASDIDSDVLAKSLKQKLFSPQH